MGRSWPALSRFTSGHPIVVYTAARLGLFAALLLPLWLVGARGLPLLVLALVCSGAVSMLLLNGVRGDFSTAVSQHFRGLNQRIDDATRSEDEEQDAPAAQDGAGATGR